MESYILCETCGERMSFQDNLNIFSIFGSQIIKWAYNHEMIVIFLFLGFFALIVIILNLPFFIVFPFIVIFSFVMYYYVKRKVKEAEKQNLQE